MTFTYSIYNDDCVAALKRLSPAQYDCIFIDPPYNTGNKKNKAAKYDRNKDFAAKNWSSFYAEWDEIQNYLEWVTTWLEAAKQLLKPTGTMFICGSFHSIPETAIALKALEYYTIQWVQWLIPNAFPNLSMTKMVNANQTIIWARTGDKHYYDKEAAKRYNNGKNLRDYWPIEYEGTEELIDGNWIINNDTQAGKLWKHPSKKPVNLVYRAFDIAVKKDDNVQVLDFFAGSGTSGSAAYRLAETYGINVHCDLVELDTEYAAMIRKRLFDETRRKETSTGEV